MARYNKSGLTVEQAQEIFDKCLKRGGKQICIKQGEEFGTWIIGNVGSLNAFYLFEDLGDSINVSYSTNPKTGISDKLLTLAQSYGFIEGDPRENKRANSINNGVSLESMCRVLQSVVLKMLPIFNGECNFAIVDNNGYVNKEDLSSCQVFKKHGVNYRLVSIYNDNGAIRIKYADDEGKVFHMKLF